MFEAHTDLSRVIGELDGRERRVLHLRLVDELSQPKIAQLLGRSQSYMSRITRSSLWAGSGPASRTT